MKSKHKSLANAPRIRLGDYIKRSTINNSDLRYGVELIEGVTSQGVFDKPRGNTMDVDLKPYKIVNNGAFVYNPSRLNLGSIAYRTDGLCIVSHLYIVFYLNDDGKKKINPEWLFMYFRRDEFYREVTFRNFGSQRPEFNFNDMSEIMIPLPDLPTQQKYVDIYKAMVANQQSYEHSLEDLKLTYEGFIEQLKKTESVKPIFPYIRERTEVNNPLKCEYLRGVGNTGFISPRQERTFDSLTKCNVFYKNDFVYNPSVLCDGAIALNKEYEMAICTEEYVVFYIENQNELIPEYLFIWLKRKETGRYIDFMSIDSVRNRVYFSDLNMISIPIPDINTQKIIVDIYNCYYERVVINEQLKSQIKNICPILIKGSLEEGKRQ